MHRISPVIFMVLFLNFIELTKDAFIEKFQENNLYVRLIWIAITGNIDYMKN